jgi:hypothetical protein
MLRALLAAVAAALTLAGTALAADSTPTTPVFDPQPAFVTPNEEGDGRLVGWTGTFQYGWWCHNQRYSIELASAPPPPFLGTTQTWTLYLPPPADPDFEGQLAHHQSWIVHLRAGWSYTLRVRAATWVTPIWYPPRTLWSEWAVQSFAVPAAAPPHRG